MKQVNLQEKEVKENNGDLFKITLHPIKSIKQRIIFKRSKLN